MTNKFRNKYRIDSMRASWWDYGNDGAYFVAICTKERIHFFGEIENGVQQLSKAGELTTSIWNEMPEHFPFVKLGAFVVMPNHVHGIIIIDKSVQRMEKCLQCSCIELSADSSEVAVAVREQKSGGVTGNSNPMLHDNLARAVRWYKGRTTFDCHKFQKDFSWQSGYYDNIIRNEYSFNRIERYIIRNPLNWQRDKFCK